MESRRGTHSRWPCFSLAADNAYRIQALGHKGGLEKVAKCSHAKRYSDAFKAEVALELLKEEKAVTRFSSERKCIRTRSANG